jgi:transcriptional regulator with XRE-family HTH domain
MRLSRNTLLIQALAAEVKARRNRLGMTQEDLAGAIELDRPYITLIEGAKKQPTISVLWRLADGLRVSPATLMAGIEKRYIALQTAHPSEPLTVTASPSARSNK